VCEHVFVSYVELHCHSAFSFLDGASLPDELVLSAVACGHTALALTDHDTLSGSMEFAQAAGLMVCAPSTGRRSASALTGLRLKTLPRGAT